LVFLDAGGGRRGTYLHGDGHHALAVGQAVGRSALHRGEDRPRAMEESEGRHLSRFVDANRRRQAAAVDRPRRAGPLGAGPQGISRAGAVEGERSPDVGASGPFRRSIVYSGQRGVDLPANGSLALDPKLCLETRATTRIGAYAPRGCRNGFWCFSLAQPFRAGDSGGERGFFRALTDK